MSSFLRSSFALAVVWMSVVVNSLAADTGNAAPHRAADAASSSALDAEHQELHARLAHLMKTGGATARAAAEVEALLQPHFVKEAQWALPPLRALPDLAAGRLPRDAGQILQLTEQLQKDRPQMLAEHQKVQAALARLQVAATQEAKPEGVQFAKALAAHALLEEQVLYPAALLVGRYLREKKP